MTADWRMALPPDSYRPDGYRPDGYREARAFATRSAEENSLFRLRGIEQRS